jgi:hypothetical protein
VAHKDCRNHLRLRDPITDDDLDSLRLRVDMS